MVRIKVGKSRNITQGLETKKNPVIYFLSVHGNKSQVSTLP